MPPIETLQEYIGKNLPHYMIPTFYVQLSQIPRLPNGKVDRSTLPPPDQAEKEMNDKSHKDPETPTEKAIVSLCEELLERKAISVTTNLFLIGADSLFAMKLHHKISQQFGVTIQIATILQFATTPQAIAEMVDTSRMMTPRTSNSKQRVVQKSIVPLTTTGSHPPLFFVHPAGGFVFMYFQLAKHLGSDQPFYAIQDPFLNSDETSPKTIEETAEVYMKEMLELVPDGPFLLGGWSMGSLIAYEIARQLEVAGKKIGIVIIIDQNIKDKYGKFSFWSENIWRGAHMMKLNIALRSKKYKKEKRYLASGFYELLSKLTHAKAELEGSEVPVSEDMVLDPSSRTLIRELDNHMKMTTEYAPGQLSAPVFILRCLEGEEKKKDEQMYNAWKEVAPQSQLVSIHCSHYNCMKEPYVKEIAEEISKALSFAVYKATGVPRESSKLQLRMSHAEILGMNTSQTNILSSCPQCTTFSGHSKNPK
jgi:thioesterase domain-containing protein/acyl carrier protein